MSTPLAVAGTWPGKLTVTRGWACGEARPWNGETPAAHLRLIRGGAGFLSEVTSLISQTCDGTVYSPALYPTSARLWKRVGYHHHSHLIIMERGLRIPFANPTRHIEPMEDPDWEALVELDHSAFVGFWRMDRTGLEEARSATPTNVVLGHSEEGGPVGYAIAGVQGSVSFLHRVAVNPSHAGQGLGADLVRTALGWAFSHGAATMLLNVREETKEAIRLYDREGFTTGRTRLAILRHQTVLN